MIIRATTVVIRVVFVFHLLHVLSPSLLLLLIMNTIRRCITTSFRCCIIPISADGSCLSSSPSSIGATVRVVIVSCTTTTTLYSAAAVVAVAVITIILLVSLFIAFGYHFLLYLLPWMHQILSSYSSVFIGATATTIVNIINICTTTVTFFIIMSVTFVC
mmetsp:Transcript_41859/g.45441  ORF Transcript_41859/g.45441 Transcript_41859/m.45441 type:complete len:160 (+) Transcript_41859:446-925(+)